MATNKRPKKSKPTKGIKSTKKLKHNYQGKLSLVIPLYNEAERLHLMVAELQKFENQWSQPYEVILVNDGSSDDTLAQLKATYAEQEGKEHVTYKIVDVAQNAGKGNALKRGVEEATGDHILTLDVDMSTSPDTLLNWLQDLEGQTFDDQTILIASREHEQSNVSTHKNNRRLLGCMFNYWVQLLTGTNIYDTQCGFKLYPKSLAKWLFGNMMVKGWAHDVELLHNAKLYDVEVVEMPVYWEEVEKSKISLWSDGIKMGAVSALIVMVNLWRFFFVNPIKETFQKKPFPLAKEMPIYRILFAAVSILLLFIMPYLSFDYGVTADEGVQKVYGDHVLKYFESDGVEGDALTYKNLYLYGGLFDYAMAWTHKYVFPTWDIYEMRHMFNALVGALLMIFTGLLARSVSQRWQVAFWSLVFIVLSPRLFGHSMNNPKDIPFAFGYILTLLFIINFVRSLPRPSLQSMLGFIIGMTITINIRVGGILLIPYLFLFTGAAFVLNKHLQPYLKRFGYLVKLTGILLILTSLGYLGGGLYWPFAQENGVAGMQTALAEMSNFSTGIRMIWNGEHYWSDFLPWYYILQWFFIATPMVILLGAALFILPILKDGKNKWLFLMLGFTGVFPLFYAILKGSSLYDGMRHFLFVYPIIVIVSAYSIVMLLNMFKSKAVTIGGSVLLLFLFYSPIRWMIVSHPNQYIYFNELFGGIGNAYNKYETDYWMNSTKEACQWMIDNIPEIKEGKDILVGTQAYLSVSHYFSDYPNVRTIYTRYHERIKKNWDYGLYVTRFVNKGFVSSGWWPPGAEKLKERVIDGAPIWAVTKRSEINKKGYRAMQAIKEKDLPKGLELLEEVAQDNPKDESALLLLAQYNLQTGQYPKAKKALDTLLAYSDSYSNSLGMMGIYQMTMKNNEEAKVFFEKATKANIKYVFGHFHLARLYAMEQNWTKVLEELEFFDKYGGKPAQGYDLGIQVTTQLRNDALKAYFTAKKLSFAGKWNEALNQLNICLRITPDYEPALKMKREYDKAVERQYRLNARNERLKREGKLKK